MINKIKSYLLIVATMLTAALPALVPPALTYADDVCGANTIGASVSQGANRAASNNTQTSGNCTTSTGVDDNSIAKIGAKIVNVFSLVIGAVAIIMIIYGGFRYIISGGDSGRVGSAKNTLIYAILGLVVVAIAQVIVHFVLNQTNSAFGGTSTT